MKHTLSVLTLAVMTAFATPAMAQKAKEKAAAPAAAPAEGVLATVNGKAIPQGRADIMIRNQVAQGQQDGDQLRNAVREELIRREQAHIDAKYEVILIQLELSRDMGLLADGNKI